MRGMLVDQNQSILGLGNNVGVGDLPAGDAQRMAHALRNGFMGFGGTA